MTTYQPTCTFRAQGTRMWSSPPTCRQPAVSVARTLRWAGGESSEVLAPRCKAHASVDRNRKYGSAEILDITPEILNQLAAEAAELEARRSAERAVKAEAQAASEIRYREQAAAKADAEIIWTRDDEQGSPDWEASREAGEPVYGPSVPKWRATSADAHTDLTVRVIRSEGYPPSIENRTSSSLTVREAIALMEMLQAAVEEAQ
jgi:hypothetical protein